MFVIVNNVKVFWLNDRHSNLTVLTVLFNTKQKTVRFRTFFADPYL